MDVARVARARSRDDAATGANRDGDRSAAIARLARWRQALLGKETEKEIAERRKAYDAMRKELVNRETWTRSRTELARAVAMDVERLPRVDEGIARDVASAQAVMRVLIAHAEGRARRGYRQGMHEVAAMVYDAARDGSGTRNERGNLEANDVGGIDANEDGKWSETNDWRFVEHDAHAMFESFMGDESDETASARGGARLRLATYYEDASTASSPINAAFRRIDKALTYIDSAVARKLAALEVEPQLYLLRWLRLGFGREFHREDVLILWDAFMDAIANGSRGGVEDFSSRDVFEGVAVSVLLSMRDDILAMEDFGSVMSRLQHVPPGIQVRHLIARAKAIAATALLGDGKELSPSPASTMANANKDRLVVPRLRSKSRGDAVAESPAEPDAGGDDASSPTSTPQQVQTHTMNDSAFVAPDASEADKFSKVTLVVPRPVSAMTKNASDDADNPFATSKFASKSAGQLLRDTSLKLEAALASPKPREHASDAAARARADASHQLTLALASLRRASALGDVTASEAAAQTQRAIDACEFSSQ